LIQLNTNASTQRKVKDAWDKYCDDTFFTVGLVNPRDLKKGVRYCFEEKGLVLLGENSRSLTARVLLADGSLSEEYKRIFAITGTDTEKMPVQIVSDKDQKVYIYPIPLLRSTTTVEVEAVTLPTQINVYLGLKQKHETDAKTTLEETSQTSGKLTADYIFNVNPNGATIKAENGNNAEAYYKELNIVEDKIESSGISSKALSIYVNPNIKEGTPEPTGNKLTFSSKIKIEGKDGDIDLPEDFFELEDNMLYSWSLLTKTQLIIIIVVCVVVVLAIIISIIACCCCCKKSKVSSAIEP